jgi:hypothetical protein
MDVTYGPESTPLPPTVNRTWDQKVESIEEKVVRIETAWLTVKVSQIYACLSNRVHGARSI